MTDTEIEHPRTCEACGATTYTFERCHQCGDVPWSKGTIDMTTDEIGDAADPRSRREPTYRTFAKVTVRTSEGEEVGFANKGEEVTISSDGPMEVTIEHATKEGRRKSKIPKEGSKTRKVYDALEQERTVRDVVEATGLSSYDVNSTIAQLRKRELVKVAGNEGTLSTYIQDEPES